MKKTWMLLCMSTLLVGASASAAGKYGMAGCGLGAMVFEDQPGMIQIVAMTLNGISGNQLFALTTGTLNCDGSSGGKKEAALFITANREALEKDIARGNGESVASLAQLMGCNNSSLFGTKMQQKFENIFPTEKTSSDSVVDSILNAVATDEQLAESCVIVG